MLIRFYVENFLSFNELTEFSMVAGKGTSLPNHVVKSGKRNVPNLLRTALIYGANASGKSNFVKAIEFAQDCIFDNDKIKNNHSPFLLNPENKQKPSKFQFEILLENNVYAYGFEILQGIILEEYLYRIENKTEKKIFHRVTQEEQTKVSFDNIPFNNEEEKQFLTFTGKGCPIDKLFLTEYRIRNGKKNVPSTKEISKISDWFPQKLKIMYPNFSFNIFGVSKEEYIRYLSHFNLGITDLHYEIIDVEDAFKQIGEKNKYAVTTLEVQDNYWIKSINKNALFFFEKGENEVITAYQVSAKHKGNDNIIFDFVQESDGTKRLFDFLPIVKNLNVTLIIDEIDRSLHPHLTRSLLELFSTREEGKMQLIATTHESTLLDLNLLRKDEIWFTEKNNEGATTLYSLEEFKPRPDTEIRKGYLQGRYGAIPFIGNLADLNW